MEIKKLLKTTIDASIDAGEEVCKIYKDEFDISYKDDKSPLTIADTRSNEIIHSYLDKTQIPILSEEGKFIPYEARKKWESFWIVDPLDGTKEFIKRNGEFTINIALIKRKKPVLGVIYVPVQKSLYFASSLTGSVKIENITDTGKDFSLNDYLSMGNNLPLKNIKNIYTVVGSKSHMTKETENFINQLRKEHGNIEVLSRGSSLKICMVAEGKANIYPRFAPTMEWDIAAGHAIVKYAKGKLINYNTQKEITYNTKSLINPWFIVER